MKKNIKFYLIIIILMQLTGSFVYAQLNFNLQGREYRLHNGKWYYYNGQLCDEIIPDRIIARFSSKYRSQSINIKNVGISGFKVKGAPFLGEYYLLKVSEKNDPFSVALSLEKTHLFDLLLFDCWCHCANAPNDDHFPDQWNLDDTKLQMEKAWGFTTGDSTIIVAVINQGTFWQTNNAVRHDL